MSVAGPRGSISVRVTWGALIYSVTQIYVLKGYKTALQPSHSISQLITVTAIYCMWGGGDDKRSELSILSRGDVLKGTLLLINA